MTTLHAVAWDIDGTLVDSEPLHHRALVRICARHGLGIAPDDQSFVGIHIGEVWNRVRTRFPSPVDQTNWQREIRAFYADHSDSIEPIPEAIETVRALAKAGVPQICVSNSSRAVVDVNLNRLGVEDCLIGSISLDDVPVGKPDPAPYRMGAEMLKLPPQSVLAVEDSITGMCSARAAGLKVALLNPSENAPSADYQLTTLSQIRDVFGL